MITITVTDFARNMKEILNRVEYCGEEVMLVRNNKKLVKLIPQNKGGSALEVMADLYRVLPEKAAETWLEDSRIPGSVDELRDPWHT